MNAKQVIFKNGECFDVKVLGGKGKNLAVLAARGLRTPDWVAISPAAFYMSLSAKSLEQWPQLTMRERAAHASSLRPTARLMSDIINTLNIQGWEQEQFAVRSSSREEDGVELSFAGQFESVLNVSQDGLVEAIGRVWRSAFSPGIEQYRIVNGLTQPALAPSVIIQKMVAPTVAGVAFGADPVTGDLNVVMISAVKGLADKLVSGEVDSATYKVVDKQIVKRHNPELAELTENQILEIVELVEHAAIIFGGPQDVEWAFEGDKLYILQSRPVTALKNFAAPHTEPVLVSSGSLKQTPHTKSHLVPAENGTGQDRLDLWDNSNIGESYPGVTTPLTFSFARAAYQRVYVDFSKLMGVSGKTIEANWQIFPQMLGLIRGRIYYNLINWYRLLALFPGFKMNRRFMEQMMGVKCELPQEFLAEFNSSLSFSDKASDVVALAYSVPNLFYKWHTLPKTISAFNKRVDKAFKMVPRDLELLSTSQLYNLYKALEKELLQKWDAPIINDFFAMISYGLLKSLCEKWIAEPGIHNQLLCDETGIISTEPAKLQRRLAEIASTDAVLIEALRSASAINVEQQTARNQAFGAAYRDYMDKFADRCFGELKLESLSLRDQPEHLLKSVAQLAIKIRSEAAQLSDTTSGINKKFHHSPGKSQRAQAERLVSAKLAASPVKKLLFDQILSQARTRIRERENLRFERTRAFGIVRRIFVEFGLRLAKAGVLENPRDIFYLEVEEVLRFVDGTTTTAGSLGQIAKARRIEFDGYLRASSPPDRFLTRGGAHLDQDYLNMTTGDANLLRLKTAPMSSSSAAIEELNGIGCCPGVVRGRARVVTSNPHEAELCDDEILIAERTDPGWITLIAHAKGIAVEYGSLLSHTAIVSRELGIPTVVSVATVTRKIESGDFIEIDGAAGTVKILERRTTECQDQEGAPYVMPSLDASVA